MSALTEKKKKEIESLYLKMKQKACRKVMLYVTLRPLDNEYVIADRILKFINKMNEIESTSYTPGTYVMTVTANWKEYEVQQKIKSIKDLPEVSDIKAYILNPLF
jgi:5,10-methylene-tetrahydrofolate dehydrogenase/methenyl tetrahydrofolate cyclohydrolase